MQSTSFSKPSSQPPPLPPRPEQQQQQQPPLQDNTQSSSTSNEPVSRGSPDCPGFERPIGQTYYVSPSIMNFDVCSACYVTHIAQTCYANRLSQVPNTNDALYCDFAVRSSRDAWSETCTRAMLPSATPEDQNNLLSHFTQRLTTIQTQVNDTVNQQKKINNELPVLRREQETEYALAQSDWNREGVTSAIQNTRIDGPTFFTPVVQENTSAQRFMRADGLLSQIRQKEDMSQRVLAGQLNDLVV